VSAAASSLKQHVRRLSESWSAEIPPHSFALMRIVLGAMGLLSLAGLTPVEMFWPLDGIAPLSSDGTGPRAWLNAHQLGTVAGWGFYSGLIVVFVAMTVGYYSDAAVLMCFVGMVVQSHWNYLPLSSAHQVLIVLIFCLLWAETGRVWSLDARRRMTEPGHPQRQQPAWPLWLMRCQIAVIYGSSGLWKIAFPLWRDGSAVHWALNLNSFHRLPWPVPPEVAPLVAFTTWATVLFELSFPLLVLFRRTRMPALAAGVALHLGLFLTLELGPFSPLMVASYLAFLDPTATPKLFARRDK
jgi:hypothetical protein